MAQIRDAAAIAAPTPQGPEPRRVSIRSMRDEDLSFATLLHADALGHGFFAQLGSPFLQGYLRTYLAGPFAIGLVALHDGAPAGLVVGTRSNRAHYSWAVRRHGVHLAALGLLALALRPPLAARFLRTRARRYASALLRLLTRRWRRAAEPGPQPDVAVLSHVAVVPGLRGQGTGRALVEAFLDEAGPVEVRLITRTGPGGAGGFYRRLGWRTVAARTDLDGLAVTEYAFDSR